MRHFFLLVSLFALFFSCKAPEARKPISVSSGSFINESINRNKELIAGEEAKIQNIIQQDTSRNYITSDGGFWLLLREKGYHIHTYC